MPILDKEQRRRLAEAGRAVAEFDGNDWQKAGLLTGCSDIINRHSRLLRAIFFNDPDVPQAATEVLLSIVRFDPATLEVIEEMVAEKRGVGGENISTCATKGRLVVFTPGVFEVPDEGVDQGLVAVMMPFTPRFEAVFEAISRAATQTGGRAVRAKDIWQHQTVIQDVFSLIFRAKVVVCDFTERNPNVFYEAGIAHALGKVVVPITQSGDDVPFDLQHHRYLLYLNNGEGLQKLVVELTGRLTGLLDAPFVL